MLFHLRLHCILKVLVIIEHLLCFLHDLLVRCVAQSQSFHRFKTLVHAYEQSHALLPVELVGELLVELHKQIQGLQNVDSQGELVKIRQLSQSHQEYPDQVRARQTYPQPLARLFHSIGQDPSRLALQYFILVVRQGQDALE